MKKALKCVGIICGVFGILEYLVLGNMLRNHMDDVKKWAKNGDKTANGFCKGYFTVTRESEEDEEEES